jgi:hypothetical protein
MAEVVPERNSLGKVLVKPKRPCNRACDLSNLKRVRKSRAVMVALRRKKNLRFVLEPTKRLTMHDAVAVALKFRAHKRGRYVNLPSLRVS